MTETNARNYWTQQMEEAHGFMTTVLHYPVEECGEPMASIEKATSAAGVEVEFSPSQIVAGYDRIFMLREALLPPFVAAAAAMNRRGWVMKVEDGYRSTAMQTRLAREPRVFDQLLERATWECNGVQPAIDFLLRRLTVLVATIPKIGTHMSGSAIDISVHQRGGSEVDRGAPYVHLSEKTPMTSPFVSPQAQRNRIEIRDLMAEHGFVAYPYEFWHFNQGDAYDAVLSRSGRPARYGAVDYDAAAGNLTPIAEPTRPLHSAADIEAMTLAALARAGALN